MRLILGVKTVEETKTFLVTGHKIDPDQLDIKMARFHSDKKPIDDLPTYLINCMPSVFCVEEIDNDFYTFG